MYFFPRKMAFCFLEIIPWFNGNNKEMIQMFTSKSLKYILTPIVVLRSIS